MEECKFHMTIKDDEAGLQVLKMLLQHPKPRISVSYQQIKGEAKTDKLFVEVLAKHADTISVKDLIYRNHKSTDVNHHNKHNDETGHELCHILRHVKAIDYLETDVRDYLFASFDARMQARLSGHHPAWSANKIKLWMHDVDSDTSKN